MSDLLQVNGQGTDEEWRKATLVHLNHIRREQCKRALRVVHEPNTCVRLDMSNDEFSRAMMRRRGTHPPTCMQIARTLEPGERIDCECARSFRLWRGFWLHVRGEMEGYPIALPDRVNATLDYTHPVFVFVCPTCGSRAETHQLSMDGQPRLMDPESSTWCQYVVEIPREWLASFGGGTHAQFIACSHACMESHQLKFPKTLSPF